MNDKQRSRLASMKAQIKSQGLTARTPHIRLTCVVCSKTWPIKTNHPEMYTDSVKCRWMCPLCKNQKEVPMAQSKEERNAAARARYAQKKVGKPTPQPEKAQPKAISKDKPRANEAWIKTLSSAVGKKLTDEQVAQTMRMANPSGKQYTEADVARHRSLYNNGRIKGQTEKPTKKLERHVAG